MTQKRQTALNIILSVLLHSTKTIQLIDLRTDVHTIIMIKEPQISAERVKNPPENHVTLQCPEADESQDVTCTVTTNADLEPTMTDNLDMPKFTAEKQATKAAAQSETTPLRRSPLPKTLPRLRRSEKLKQKYSGKYTN